MSHIRASLVGLVLALALPAQAGADAARFAAPSDGGPPRSAGAKLSKAEALRAGHGVRRGFELSPALREVAVALPALDRAERRRARRLLARPTSSGGSPGEPPYAVAEQAPYCGVRFCVHWVATTADRPPLTDSDGDGVPNYVETTMAVFERVHQVENVQLGWRTPKPDGARGCPRSAPSCMNRIDVYLKQIGDEGLYGFAAADPGQRGSSRHAYLVVDNDYADSVFDDYPEPLQPLEVTAAHEYNHVVQFAYDIELGTWMFEATAVWMEENVYPEVDDYLQFLPAWAELTLLPLTNEVGAADEFIGKTYGNAVWNTWLEARFGADAIREAWERSLDARPVPSFAPGAYDLALAARGWGFYRAFTRFAADTAEWRAADSPFPEGATFPDVARAVDGETDRALAMRVDRSTVGGRLPHATHVLLDVRRTSKRRIKLLTTARRGARVAIALVGRTGSETGGASTVALRRMSRGGRGQVTLRSPGRFARLTAVLVNGDVRTTGRRFADGEWEYRRDVPMTAWLSSDFSPPRIARRSPQPGRRGVSRRARVRVRFSERMLGVRAATALLRGPRGRTVKARVRLARGRVLTIRPRRRLGPGARYSVRLGASVTDRGGNTLPRRLRTWTFRTRR